MIYVTLRASEETGNYASTVSRDGVLQWKDIPTTIHTEHQVSVIYTYLACLAMELGVEVYEILMVPISMQPLDQVP